MKIAIDLADNLTLIYSKSGIAADACKKDCQRGGGGGREEEK